jgi:hypothetical protein
MCIGRGTNTRGSLCTMCNGIGEIPVRTQPEAVEPKRHNGRERPVRN